MTGAPYFSVIVPAYNEEQYLPRLLDTIDAARSRYHRGPDGVEVIVGDNVSTDATAQIAASRGCSVVTVEKRVIGAVRNAASRIARGELIAFVDADARIHPETFNAVEARMTTGNFIGGATGVRLERWSLGLAVTYALMVPWVVLLRMDTGFVFCRRADFEAIGGYDESRLFAEDVALLIALRRLGRTRGQKLTRVRSVKALASMRKFDEHGEWHYFTMVGTYLLDTLTRRDRMGSFADRYWYKPRR